MKEYIVETDNITLALNTSSLNDTSEEPWILTLNDRYGHYETEVKLRSNQMCDLLGALEEMSDDICKEEML